MYASVATARFLCGGYAVVGHSTVARRSWAIHKERGMSLRTLLFRVGSNKIMASWISAILRDVGVRY